MSVLLDIVAGREGGDDLNCFSLFGGIGLGEVWQVVYRFLGDTFCSASFHRVVR